MTKLSKSCYNAFVNRIIDNHAQTGEEVDINEIYVYRIIVQDSATCQVCRRFYGNVGEIPKIYRLSTLLDNGTNFGKHTSTWKPVVGGTHPNARTSQIIEIPPRFIVLPGGRMNFVGKEKAKIWLREHLQE